MNCTLAGIKAEEACSASRMHCYMHGFHPVIATTQDTTVICRMVIGIMLAVCQS